MGRTIDRASGRILRLGVFGDRAFGLMQGLMGYGALPGRRKLTGYLSGDDLVAIDGEVAFYPPLHRIDFSGPEGHARAMEVRGRLAKRLLQAAKRCLSEAPAPEAAIMAKWSTPRLRKSACADMRMGPAGAGTLKECLCMIEAVRGADRESLVKAYGEATVRAVCGGQAD